MISTSEVLLYCGSPLSYEMTRNYKQNAIHKLYVNFEIATEIKLQNIQQDFNTPVLTY